MTVPDDMGVVVKGERCDTGNTEYDTYFWVGLPYNLKDKPFSIKDVTNVMETLLHRRHFDAKRLKSRYSKKEYTDTDSESDLDDSDMDNSMDNESDSGFETYTPKRKSKRKSKKYLKDKEDKQKSSKDDQGKTSTTPKKVSKQDTTDELVDKMNTLSIHEPAYAKAYFKAISINSLVEKVYPMPVTKGSNTLTTKGRVDNQQAAPINQENTENQTRRRFSYSTCIGCASPDHQTIGNR
ncbi:hypothetical protein V8E55_006440 [Tylopilus felleus]